VLRARLLRVLVPLQELAMLQVLAPPVRLRRPALRVPAFRQALALQQLPVPLLAPLLPRALSQLLALLPGLSAPMRC
jgi:hypothetical protein